VKKNKHRVKVIHMRRDRGRISGRCQKNKEARELGKEETLPMDQHLVGEYGADPRVGAPSSSGVRAVPVRV